MINENLLKKIQGLLSKTVDNGCSVEEAATAAGLAQKLIKQHRLSMSDIDIQADNDEPINRSVMPGTTTKRTSMWKSSLANIIAKFNDCKMYIDFNGKNKDFKIIGRSSDIQIVNYMYQFLTREIERVCKQEKAKANGYGKSWANSFKMGAVSAVVEKLEEANKESKATAESSAIVRVEQRINAVEDWAENNGLKLRSKKTSFRYNPSAWESGREAGSKLSVRPGIGADNTRLL